MGYTAFDATAQNQGTDVLNYHAIRRERMIMKRVIAFLLSIMTVINFTCPVAAEQTSTDTQPQFHTVTWTMNPEYTLEPITGSRTSMLDEGSILTNAEGNVQTEIQTVYHTNQTLATVGMAGTSFSFAPIMLDEYYPQEAEVDPAGTENEPVNPDIPEDGASEEDSEEPEDQADNQPGDDQHAEDDTTDPEEQADQPVNLPEDDQNAEEDQPGTDQPEEPVPADDSDTENESDEDEELLHAGYGKTTNAVTIYQDAHGKDAIGTLPTGVFVFIASVSGKYTHIIFDTPDEEIKGYVHTDKLINLEKEAEEDLIAVIRNTENHREYKDYPLPRTTTFTRLQEEQEETDEEEDESPSEPADDTPQVATPTDLTGSIHSREPSALDLLLGWIIPSACAEEALADSEEKPEEDTIPQQDHPIQRARPSSITGQKIGGAAKAKGLRSAPSSAGNVSAIVYPGLFDAVTDVRLSATTTGIKEDIIVSQYTGNHQYAYTLRTDGLSAVLSGKSVELFDDAGHHLATIDAPDMTDANGNYSKDIEVSLTGSNGNYMLTYIPNDAWMQSVAYPVTIDPTGQYVNNLSTGIGDVYVTSSNPTKHYEHRENGSGQTNHSLESTNLYAGTVNGESIAYVIPSLRGLSNELGSQDFPTNTPLLIHSATWRVNVHEVHGSGPFRISLITGNWNTSTVTYNTRPSLSSDIYIDVSLQAGWNEIDVTKIFSAWFNALDQKQNYGFAITSTSSWARICASDIRPYTDRMKFTATYYTGIGKPTLTATGHGNNVNSGSGWVDLNWNAIEGAQGYVLGVWNGQSYEYRYIGNTTSWSSDGKKLWPTQAEISSGRYALHWDGGGQELPTIPRASQSNLNYIFTVLPSNAYGQVADSNTAATAQTTLPDRLAPNQPSSVAVSPAGYTNASSVQVTWAGVKDLPSDQGITSGGKIQYAVDPSGSDPTGWSWNNTGSSDINGSFNLNVSGLSDGGHTVYIRGVDASGNYGIPKGEILYIDRTGPAKPTVSFFPDSWTSQNTGALSWDGISDINPFHVEYRIDNGSYINTNVYSGKVTGYSLNIASLSDGIHTIDIRGVDSAGNVGAAGQTKAYIDRTPPTLDSLSVVPPDWTNQKTVILFWKGAKDNLSGLKEIAYAVDNGSYQALAVSEDGSVTINVENLSDGEHSALLKLTDNADVSITYQTWVCIDRSDPIITSITPDPASWTSQDILLLRWTGVRDEGSGVKRIAWSLDSGEKTDAVYAENSYCRVDASELEDGPHTLTLYAEDYLGYHTEGSTTIYIDRTPPVVESWNIAPVQWSHDTEATLSWQGVMDETSGLKEIEYQIDDGEVVLLSLQENGEATVDTSSLEDGEHTFTFAVTDQAGVTVEYTETLYIDRTPPTIEEASVTPNTWADTNTLEVLWKEAADAHSGLNTVEYSLDQGKSFAKMRAGKDGDETISVSGIPDGEHEIILRFTDQANNPAEITLGYQIDRTPPEAKIIDPADGAMVSGVLDIQGTVQDISLTDWTFTASDADGRIIKLSGDEVKGKERLGLVDTGIFPDGDKISVKLTVHDAAGHETTCEGIYIKAVHQAQPVDEGVRITAPENNEELSVSYATGSYQLLYQEKEAKGIFILDRKTIRETENLQFPVYPILYPENSTHTLSVISTDQTGQSHYSQGYQGVLAFSDLLHDSEKIESYQGIDFTESGAVSNTDNASFTLKPVTIPIASMAIRLHSLSDDSSAVTYEYSTDQGKHWTFFPQDQDIVFDSHRKTVLVRCKISKAGVTIQGLDIRGIYEGNPVRFQSVLLRPVHAYSLKLPVLAQYAHITAENDCTETLTDKALYIDGEKQADSDTLHLLPYVDGLDRQVAQAGINKDGTLYGSGAKTAIILRDTPNATGTYKSGEIELQNNIFALRVEALCLDADQKSSQKGQFAYSLNGTDWKDFALAEYCFLPTTTKSIYLRASLPEEVTLSGIHAEGVTLAETTIAPLLVSPATDVLAKDYGKHVGKRRYELFWTDPNPEDTTHAYTTYYDVYRNGELLATVTECSFTDRKYYREAIYEIVIRREYEDPQDGKENILSRSAVPVVAENSVMPVPRTTTTQTSVPVDPTPQPSAAPTPRPTLRPVVVTAPPKDLPTYVSVQTTPSPSQGVQLIDFQQEESPYANGTYSTDGEIPAQNFSLNQSLLGPSRFCSLGFEPVNFNTGNFFVEARDFTITDIAGTGIDLIRTYNSQSLEGYAPIGAKWSSEITQTLSADEYGIIYWRRADGSQVRFMKTEDGYFITDTSEYETLEETEEGYTIRLTDGSAYVFSAEGSLSRIEKNNGQQVIRLVYQETTTDKTTTSEQTAFRLEKIILPSGREIHIETNKEGQITKIILPGNSTIRFSYTGNLLTAVTDANGQTTRYEYDEDGLMTAWYDGNGTCQVQNTYDSQARVIAQTDANGGEYRLEYGDDFTVTTDAEGNTITYSRDEKQRTSKIIDARGGVTSFTYGIQGEIISKTDPLGQITLYDYNEQGDKISETDPRGAAVFFTWDDNHHLLSRKDQNGNITEYTYDEKGNLLTETAPNGGVTSYTYNEAGQLITKTDALGNSTQYTYNKQGQLETETDPLGNTTAYTYDDNGYPATQTNALGEVTHTKYDAKGNLLKITFADQTTISYTYDALGRQTSMTDPRRYTTKYQYDGLGQLVRTILPDGSVQEAEYTPSGRLKATKDALGNTIFYTYDRSGNQLTEADADGYTTESEYDLADRLVSQTNALGGKTTYTYDPVGLPLSVTDPSGVTQSFVYDSNGNILTRILPNGAAITAEYDNMNQVVRQVNTMGGETRVTYDMLGRITEVTDPLGAKTEYTYDANSNVLTVTDALGNTTQYTYDALNRVVSEEAPNGAVTRYDYDTTGNLISTIDALGNRTTYEYDASGNLTAITDALGHKATVQYDKNGQSVAAKQKNGGMLASGYDKAGRLVSETDANGHKTQYKYNARGLVIEITDAANQKAMFEYDALGNIVRITAPGDSITLYSYDAAGRIQKTTDPIGCETVYAYDTAGQIVQTAINGNACVYEYDAAGNIAAVTDAEGRRIELRYDKAGNITDVIYPDGSKETTEYDILGRTIKATPRTGLTTEYTYDMLGNVTSVRQGEQVTRYEYDLMGRQTMTISADGSESTYEYDALGNLITSTNPLGNSTAFTYTPESLLERVTYANGSQQSLTYDLAGNITSETDAEGYTKRYHYDAVNRLIGVTDELGHKTSYTYDPTDNIAQVRDALGHITGYTYDANGNLTSETDALGNIVRYEYTPEGWLEKVIKADGTEITFEYDKTGNLLTQHAGDEYTISSGYNELGQIAKVSSEAGVIEYQYDDRGYLISVKNVNGETVSYTYDQYGNKESMTYPDGRTVWYTYDAMNRLVNVTDLDGEITHYSYDAAGRRIKTENSTLTTAYEYDMVGNLIRQETSGISSIAFNYSHNKNGYITSEVREESGVTTASQYGYDALGQLVSFRQSTGYGEQYTYDAAGNMTKKVISPEQTVRQKKSQPVIVKMKYNPGNQLTEMAVGKDKISYSYDPNGSMVRKVLTSQKYGTLTDEYTYDVLDQFTGYYGYDGYTQILTYDANGMRLSKKEKGNTNRLTLEELLRGNIPGLPKVVEPAEETIEEGYEWATTEYLYDIVQEHYQVIQETTTNRTEHSAVSYSYGLERIAAYSGDDKTTYIYDGSGSAAQSIGSSWINGDAHLDIQSIIYTPFGEQLHTKVNEFTYNAEAYDMATGMLNLRARQYEPAMNRFDQKDILKGEMISPLSMNRFGYCENNPMMFVDPSGMSLEDYYNVIHDFNPKKVFDNVLKNKGTNYSEVRKNDGVRKKVIKSINDALQTVFNCAIKTYNELNEHDQKLLDNAQKSIKEINESNMTVEEKQKYANAVMSRTCLALATSMNSSDYIVLTYEDDEDPNKSETVVSKNTKQKLNNNNYNGELTSEYADKNWDNNEYESDCMNYLSKIAHNNGLPYSDEWKPRSNTWKLTKGNYNYMTNKNGTTNTAFAGEILFSNSEEGKAMIDVGVLIAKEGDFLYSIPSDQSFPDHGYVVYGVNSQTNYPQVTAHTTNRLNTDFDEAIDLAPIRKGIPYSYSVVYMGGNAK